MGKSDYSISRFTPLDSLLKELNKVALAAQRRLKGPEDEESWLDVFRTSFAKARSFLKPYPNELMAAHDVSAVVNSAKYEGPECIQTASDDDIPPAGPSKEALKAHRSACGYYK
jgi:hypothetical protein